MYVVIVGMGEVGRYVTQVLQSEQHDVVAIDNDTQALHRVGERADVAVLSGYGASLDVLVKARAHEADLVVAVTNFDEVNLLAALASKHIGAKRTIARLQGKEYSNVEEGIQYGMLGIDVVVNPRVLVAQEIAKIARSHGALDVLGLAGNRIEVVQLELKANSKVLHKPLTNLSLPEQVLVAAVVRDRELFVPGGADVLLPGDRVYLVGRTGHMEVVEEQFCGGREAARVCIVGGGVVGEALARSLTGADVEVLVIEKNRDAAERLAMTHPKVTVVHGDGTNLTLLEEEQVGSFDLFCAVSHEDEVNLMSGLLAKRVGASRTVSLVHRPDYMDIYRQLGIDVVLSPRQTASDHILKWVRQTELKSLTILEGGQAEILELEATAGSRVVGTPIKRLNFPRGAILGAIVSRGAARVPRGEDVITPGDTVVVLTTASTRSQVERLFRRRML
ncbi:Trk system potassium transporter TrkA [Myxococcota bacterium]|nr:Trk system potassium transporter TrkA [Myxococcota bacterium]